MHGKWYFNAANPSDVRIGVTQRDQFNNDDVGLTEALVREAIQNSLDAASSRNPVEVRFYLNELEDDECNELRCLFAGLLPHLNACGLDLPECENQRSKVLVIEDYNTRGLTGSLVSLDGGDFDNFWRAVGESGKSGQKGGRWGLGKLVYSSSSEINTFFGLTVRECDRFPAVMGQAVLKNHTVGGRNFVAHGFWCDDHCQLTEPQRPFQDAGILSKFKALFGVQRDEGQPGLSVVVPFVGSRVSEDDIIKGVVRNYFFPILAGQLIVQVGQDRIDARSFKYFTRTIGRSGKQIPFDFVREISGFLNSDNVEHASGHIGRPRLTRENFAPDQIDAMKNRFSNGKLVHCRVPVELRRKTGQNETGSIDLFVRSLADGESAFSLFARGPITLPGERQFQGSMALGAMIANEGVVAEFLGDAENPAHTAWNANAEKLAANWDDQKTSLSSIRRALRDFFDLVYDQKEMKDDDALIDFFSIAEKTTARKKRKKVRKPTVNVQPREAAIRIHSEHGGFRITSAAGAQSWEYPKRIRVRMAYDMIGFDPFRRFSLFDFDLRKSGNIGFEVVEGRVEIRTSNTLFFDVTGPDFCLRAFGFDARRDLIVDARTPS